MKRVGFFFCLCWAAVAGRSQSRYPGGGSPTDSPTLFAPRAISTGLSTRDIAISPEGNEIFFTIQHPKFISSTIIRMTRIGGVWGKPEVAPFSGVFRDLEPCYSWNGDTLYFSSDRPGGVSGAKRNFDIWRVVKKAGGTWGKPENLGDSVNSPQNEFYPSVAKNGNLYFTVEASYGKGSEDIVVCKKTAMGYAGSVSLPEGVNTKYDEFNAFIDPDEKYIIFGCQGRPDENGGGDLYISHRDAAGGWTAARQLPVPINSKSLDYVRM